MDSQNFQRRRPLHHARNRRPRRRGRVPVWLLLAIATALLAGGCAMVDRASTAFETVTAWNASPAKEPASLNNDTIVQAGHYQAVASRIDYSEPAASTKPPAMLIEGQSRELRPPTDAELRPLSLAEAIQMALQNNAVIRVDGDFLSPRSSLMLDPDRTPSIYDIAIIKNGFQIGQRGEDAALSDFAPRLSTSMIWGRDENVQNNLFQSGGLQPGDTLYQETATFNSRLEKIFDDGSLIALRGDVNYSLNNAPARLFGSVYTGLVAAEYRLPFWQGAGVEYTQIAGPIARQNPTVLGVNQGVVISRLNADMSVTQFEAEVRNQIFDVNQVYWDLYLAFQTYEVQTENVRNLNNIREKVNTKARRGLEGGGTADAAQGDDSYFTALAAQRQALADLFETEGRLRRLLGLPPVDGKVLRPSDVPQSQSWQGDWTAQLYQALSNRVELRRQKMAIRSLQLQLRAACSLVQPRADFIARYRVNAFGDRLISPNDNDGFTPHGLRSYTATLVQGDQTGWDLGVEVAVPLGFLAEKAQIRNLEWRLAKAKSALSAQELEIQHELRNAWIRLQRWHSELQFTKQRRDAAEQRVAASRKEFDLGRKQNVADLLLRAQISSGEAQSAYFRALAQYNKAIANLSYRSGAILGEHNVQIREGTPPQTFADATMLLSTGEEPGLFQRMNPLPVVSRWLSPAMTWEQKSDSAMRQSLPPAYFGEQSPQLNTAAEGMSGAPIPPLTLTAPPAPTDSPAIRVSDGASLFRQ